MKKGGLNMDKLYSDNHPYIILDTLVSSGALPPNDEQIETQQGNNQRTIRSVVNRFWKEKLKRQKYI